MQVSGTHCNFRDKIFQVSFLLLFVGAQSYSQTVYFLTLDQPVIESRLREVPSQNNKRMEVLEKMFREAGCPEQRLTEQPVGGTKWPNIICTLPGETDSTIIVGGHYDTNDRGSGIIENWSGASLLPSLYESLKGESHHHTIAFVSFSSGEQRGLGSEFYVNHLTKEQLARIAAMVNLDCLGLSTTKVEVDRSDKHLLGILVNFAKRLSLPLEGMNISHVLSSDSVSFQRRKIPVISIHSLTQVTYPIIFSPQDNFRAVNMAAYYDTYRLVTVFLAGLDALLN